MLLRLQQPDTGIIARLLVTPFAQSLGRLKAGSPDIILMAGWPFSHRRHDCWPSKFRARHVIVLQVFWLRILVFPAAGLRKNSYSQQVEGALGLPGAPAGSPVGEIRGRSAAVEQVHQAENRMPEGHTRACIAHHLPNRGAHVRLVAMDGTVGASGFLGSEGALLKAGARVGQQLLAFSAKSSL